MTDNRLQDNLLKNLLEICFNIFALIFVLIKNYNSFYKNYIIIVILFYTDFLNLRNLSVFYEQTRHFIKSLF